ncbi:MAG: FAD-binding oxidoreductase, partial [Defluviitaleaceae bacterium]|nr:FAD-binding oxidoreductase [Defluviitaleaceae bacterium]
NLSREITASIYCDKDIQINPYMTVMAYSNLAKRRGAEILSGTEVFGINMEAGKIVSVETSAGVIATSLVIVANGYMSRPLVRPLGINLPIFPQRLESLVTEPSEKLLTRTIHGMRYLTAEEAETDPQSALEYEYKVDAVEDEADLPKIDVEDTIFAFLKPTMSGTMVLGTTSEFVGIDRRTTPRGLSAIIKESVKICPKLANANIIRTWAALIPFTFDSKPILGKVPDFEGLYIAAGHPHAMSHAPAVGEAFAELFFNENNLSERSNFIFEQTSITRFPNWRK